MDLKIKDVAELLSVSETTVRRWLSEGRIPAYRLHRQYRFNRTEIEDWVLQQKIGFGKEKDKKIQEESIPNTTGTMQFSLYRALYRGDVHHDIQGNSKETLIRSTMLRMARRFELDPEVLTELFLDRERLMPTSLGHGIGVPHTRDFLLPTHYDVITIVYPEKPIEYGALDGLSVHTLFFLFASEDKHHLHLLAKLAHLASSEKARQFLTSKPSKENLLDFVKHWESNLTI